jgi:hypothetical protein
MRKLTQEILFFLWLLEEEEKIFGSSAVQSLGYEEFMALRPNYADSSWRVQLNRLVRERLILKQTRQKRTTFRLTRLGQERVRQVFFQNLYQEKSDIYTLVLLKPRTGQKTQYSAVQRILESEGYLRFFTGVYLKPGKPSYSDFLWRSLSKQGFLPLFTQIRSQEVRPASLGEILLDENELYLLQASWQRFSSELDEVLSKMEVRKILESRDKDQIGRIIVSGLSAISKWSPVLEESLARREEVVSRLNQMRAMLVFLLENP